MTVGRQRWLVVGPGAALLLVITATTMTSEYDIPVLVSYAAATAQAVALPLAMRQPWPALALQLAGVMTFAWTQGLGDWLWPIPVPVMAGLLTHLALVGLSQPWRVAVLSWWISVLFGILLTQVDPRARVVDDGETSLILYSVLSVLVLFGSIAWSQRAAVRRQLAEARRDVALEQAQRALVEERTRIARELHDVVAHSMSVIHMQATSAAYRIESVDPESRAEFTRIAAGTRTALREMRQLLAVLRDETTDGESPELYPVPNLADIGALAESVRRAGVPVELDVNGLDGVELPDTVGLAAYRIAQEALSNVVRHAPGAATRVRAVVTSSQLTLEVVNDAPARPPGAIEEPNRVSHGLVGMRERARLADGALQIGPEPGGGYRVAVSFPLTGTETPEENSR